MRQTKGLFFCVLLMLLTACSSGSQTPTAAPAPGAPQTAPPGTTTIKGRVVKPDGTPLADASVRFSEVYRQNGEAVFVLDEARSPGTLSDAQGNFAAVGIPAREYVMVVGDPYTDYVIVPAPDGTKQVWNGQADQVVDTGEIKIDLP